MNHLKEKTDDINLDVKYGLFMLFINMYDFKI